MSTSAADPRAPTVTGASPGSLTSSARAYFASDTARTIQTALGLIWLLDGALQFQSFMYGKGFIQLLTGLTAGQPHWISSSVTWGANTLQGHQTLFNTGAALVQVAIGLGLLYRPAVKPALAVSFGWVLVVWWFGEAFGMMFMTSMNTGGATPAPMASPLTGAPGAVLLYAIIGLIAWPTGRSARARRHGKPLMIRRDFNTVDGGQAGLHFVSVQRTVEDFITTRNAMNATTAQLQNPAITDTVNNGINEFIFVLRRANYILPSRADRAFPLLPGRAAAVA